MNPIAKSYIRHVLIAIMPLLTVESTQWSHYAFAATIAILGPLVRLLDPNDHNIDIGQDDDQ
jgi:hypothetical protein